MWKRKKQTTQEGSATIGQHLGNSVGQVKRRWADGLNNRTSHWNQRQKIIFLVLACGLLLGINIISILQDGDTSTKLHEKANVVPIPKYWIPSHDRPLFDSRDSAAFMAFRQRLDSLNATSEGRQQLAAFSQTRPGFLDSMLHVERQIFPTLPPIKLSSPINPSTP